MKAVMISIRPEWCDKIARYLKTIEVRKTKPKLETPFKVYIYCTIGCRNPVEYEWCDYEPNGVVIGEFICDAIVVDKTFGHDPMLYTAACMTPADIAAYCVNSEMYGWHISELKIYDKPKELSEFLVEDNRTFDCPGLVAMKRPPQSWGYIESLEENDESNS